MTFKFKHEYCLIITVTHAIFDGISAFAALVSLFFIIQALYTGVLDEQRDIYDSPVIDPVETWLRTYLAENNRNYADLGAFQTVQPFSCPTALTIQPGEARLGYEPTGMSDTDSFFFSALDGKPVISLNDLKRISEASVTKFHLTMFEGEKFKNFAAKCKQHKAKVWLTNGLKVQ